MHFIVDFENTDCRGLKGVQYLQKEDKLDIFFSKCCSNIEMEYWEDIIRAGCEFNICKLEKAGHNALDFYIASRIGELFGRGTCELIAIVSKDKGFSAVRDYWQIKEGGRKIVLKPDIEQCILFSNELSERRKIIQTRKKILSLEIEYKKYTEHQHWLRVLEPLFSEKLNAQEMESVLHFLEEKKKGRTLYLNLLKRFGRERGLYIYRGCKDLLNAN